MVSVSIEVSGPDAECVALELRASLAAAAEPGDCVWVAEVERSAELVVAVIGLVFSAVSTAKTVWDWWRDRRSAGVTVRILLADGTVRDLSDVDRERPEIELGRRATSGQ